jgi:hypothetical protein
MEMTEDQKCQKTARELSEGPTRQVKTEKPVFSGETTHPAGSVLDLPENQALDLCLSGGAKAWGSAVSWFQDIAKEVAKKFKPAPPVEPPVDLAKPSAEAESGPLRMYKCQTIGSKGIFVKHTTYVGTLYLSEADARTYVNARVVKLIEPKTLPPLPEPKFVVRKSERPNDTTVTLIPA